jgi:hypothetical protein
MQVEVDQSGKIERTQKPTALAFANGTHFSILISAKAKREIFNQLKRRRVSRSETKIHILVFSTLLFLLLKDRISQLESVTVDVEYHGHDRAIKEHFLNLCRRHRIKVSPQVLSFHLIGKKSPAHDLAIGVFRGNIKADREIDAGDVLAEF